MSDTVMAGVAVAALLAPGVHYLWNRWRIRRDGRLPEGERKLRRWARRWPIR
jgi:hypothetical protein